MWFRSFVNISVQTLFIGGNRCLSWHVYPPYKKYATDEKIETASIFTPCTDGWKKCFKCDDRSRFLVRRVNTSCMTTTISPQNKMFLRSKRFSFSSKYETFFIAKSRKKKFFAQQFSLYFFSIQWQENCTRNRTETKTIQSKSNKGFAT